MKNDLLKESEIQRYYRITKKNLYDLYDFNLPDILIQGNQFISGVFFSEEPLALIVKLNRLYRSRVDLNLL